MQQCLAIVDPWDDDRDDLRAAVHTMAVMPDGDFDRQEAMEHLIAYLKINERETPSLGATELRRMVES